MKHTTKSKYDHHKPKPNEKPDVKPDMRKVC